MKMRAATGLGARSRGRGAQAGAGASWAGGGGAPTSGSRHLPPEGFRDAATLSLRRLL